MEQADRDKILQSIEKIIQYTEYDKLMRLCIDQKLIFDVMREQIEVNLNYFWSFQLCVAVIHVWEPGVMQIIYFFSPPL